jgi:hypothetical protein
MSATADATESGKQRHCRHAVRYENRSKHMAHTYMGAEKSLARPDRKQATATEDFDVHIFYL